MKPGATSPHEDTREETVLGCLLRSPEAVCAVADRVPPSAFFQSRHRVVYEAILAVAERGETVCDETVLDYLLETGQTDDAGGIDKVLTYSMSIGSVEILDYAVRKVLEAARRHELWRAAGAAHESLCDRSVPVAEVVENVEAAIEAATAGETQRWRGLGDVVRAARDEADAAASPDRASGPGVPTGFTGLDRFLGGLRPGDLVVLAARPGMGKTSLGLQVAAHVAGLGETVGFASLEMPAAQLGMRLLAGEARVPLEAIRSGWAVRDGARRARLDAASERLWALQDRLLVDDSPRLGLAELRARARQLKARSGLGLLVVDYLQRMAAPKAESREQAVSALAVGLKTLARQLGAPVLALAQLNRACESRQDKRPMLSDLRESGSVEQEADVVLLLYRDDVYRRDSPDKCVAEVHVAKHRNGPTGRMRLAFLGEYTQFADLAEDDEQNAPSERADRHSRRADGYMPEETTA